MDVKALFGKALTELLQKDRIIAFALGLVITVLAAITKLPSDKVHDAVCGAPAVSQPAQPAPAAEPVK